MTVSDGRGRGKGASSSEVDCDEFDSDELMTFDSEFDVSDLIYLFESVGLTSSRSIAGNVFGLISFVLASRARARSATLVAICDWLDSLLIGLGSCSSLSLVLSPNRSLDHCGSTMGAPFDVVFCSGLVFATSIACLTSDCRESSYKTCVCNLETLEEESFPSGSARLAICFNGGSVVRPRKIDGEEPKLDPTGSVP